MGLNRSVTQLLKAGIAMLAPASVTQLHRSALTTKNGILKTAAVTVKSISRTNARQITKISTQVLASALM